MLKVIFKSCGIGGQQYTDSLGSFILSQGYFKPTQNLSCGIMPMIFLRKRKSRETFPSYVFTFAVHILPQFQSYGNMPICTFTSDLMPLFPNNTMVEQVFKCFEPNYEVISLSLCSHDSYSHRSILTYGSSPL